MSPVRMKDLPLPLANHEALEPLGTAEEGSAVDEEGFGCLKVEQETTMTKIPPEVPDQSYPAMTLWRMREPLEGAQTF